MTNESLSSIGQLCDDDCIDIFSKNDLNIFKNKKLLLQEKRNKKDGLWDVPLTPTIKHRWGTVNLLVHKNKSKSELAQYLHACAGSLVISTFQKAINNGNFITWPGIDKLNFNALIQTTLATIKDHLN